MFIQYANYSSSDRTARLARRKYKKQGKLRVAIAYGEWMIKVLGKLAQELRNKNIPNKRALFEDISITMVEIEDFVSDLKDKRKDELNRLLKGK